MKCALKEFLFAGVIAFTYAADIHADAVIATVPTGTNPMAIAIDSVTNMIYVANADEGSTGNSTVTVINGLTNSTTTVAVGANPQAIAVNPVTNMIYVANTGALGSGSNSTVTAINGVTDSTTSIPVGENPWAIAVNPVTNMIYVANIYSQNITVINGSNNATTTISVNGHPNSIAVDPVTNMIYAATPGSSSNTVTVINGSTNATTSINVGASAPQALAVNPVTNMIYVSETLYDSVTIINGSTNVATSVMAGNPSGIAVNPVTNMIYVVNDSAPGSVTEINGATNATTNVSGMGGEPRWIAVNPRTNTIYVSGTDSNTVTEINGATNAKTSFNVGGSPEGLAVNTLTNMTYVANYNSSTVSVIAGIPAAPALASPSNGTVNEPTSMTLDWTPVTGAATYSVQVSTVSTFASTVSSQTGLTAISAPVSGLANSAIYYWEARATNVVGTSVWSGTWSFTTIMAKPAVPVLATPTSGAINEPTSLTLNWGSVTSAASYSILISTGSSFGTTVSSQTGLTGVSASLAGIANSATYYWEVNATNIGGTSAWSGSWSFTTIIAAPAAPVLASPSSGAGNLSPSPKLSWNSSAGAATYRVQLSNSSAFSTTVIDSTLSLTADSVTQILFWGEYFYWHVSATNIGGASSWSSTWSFTVAQPPGLPVLASPTNGAINQPLSETLNWSSSSGATSYGWLVSTSSMYSTAFAYQSGVTSTSAIVSGLSTSTTYYWEVNASNIGGTTAYAQGWSFTTVPPVPGAPVLSTPTSGSFNQPVALTLNWQSVNGAVSYSVAVSTTSSFATTDQNQGGLSVTSLAMNGLSNSTTCYWEVNATNAGGTSAWSGVWSFTTIIATPVAPTLASPTTGAGNQPTSLTLNWGTVTGAASYSIMVSTNSAFSSTVSSQTGITGVSASVGGLANSTNYYWKVNANNVGGTSAWSGVWSFTTVVTASGPAAPVLISPTNGASGLAISPTLTWGSVAGAVSYNVQIGYFGSFSGSGWSQTGITSTSISPSLFANNIFAWGVSATNAGGTSAWSSVWTFTTAPPVVPPPPVLASPTNGTVNVSISPVFSWGSSAGATSYGVEVSVSSTFATTNFGQTGLGLSTSFSGLANNTTYYWAVNATNAGGTSPWSGVWSFTTGQGPSAPVLYSPTNGAIGVAISPTLTWGSVAGAVSYNVQIGYFGSFSGSGWSQTGITSTSISHSLFANNTFAWGVSATNAGGTSAWSSVWTFTTTIATPVAPTLASPSTGAGNQPTSLTLNWGTVTGAASYSVLVSASSTFGTTVSSQTGLTGVSALVGGLANSTSYYWEVNATNAGGTSLWSNSWNFTTVIAAPGVPSLSKPANGAINQPTTVSIMWGKVNGASTYSIMVSTSSTFSTTVSSQTGIGIVPGWVSGLANSTTYYWEMNATNAGGASAWSGVWSFTTIMAAPALPVLASPTNGAINQPVVLSLYWGSVATAASYSVQVSTDMNFGTTVLSQTGLTGVSDSAGGLANSTSYYWEVNATNIGGSSAWSAVWSFGTIVSNPVLALPANGAVGQPTSLTMNWNTVAGASSYCLQVSTTLSFATTVSSQAGITASASTVSGLANSSLYYWQVNAGNAGATGAWSGVWSFWTIFAPPVLALPANGAVGLAVSPTISWAATPGATSYSLQVSTISTFSTTCSSQSGLTSASCSPAGLAYYTTYYWQVNAANGNGTSLWSGTWSFTTAAHLAIPMASGWFMYSLNIHPADSSTNGVFGRLKGFILAMDGSDNLYWPGASLDEIGTIHTGSGYWVLDTLPKDTLNLTGSAVNISSTPVSLPASNWNLVSYLPQVSMPVTNALASINSQLVLAMDGASNFYWPAASLNEIGTMTVGNGYYIVTSAAASLTYPTAGSSPAKQLSAALGLAKLANPPAPAHFAKRALTGNFAAFMAQHVEIGGKLAADKCEVGAYDTKGNLVGSGTVVNGLTAFALCGKDPRSKAKNGCLPSEKITFKLWNGKTEYPLTVTRGSEPVYAARTILSATLAVPAGALISAFNLSRAYPNPFKGSVNIAFDVPTIAGVSQHAVQIDIFDMKGSLVKQLAKGTYQAGHYELPWNCNESREGVAGSSMYIVRMKAANFEKRLKLVRIQ